MRHRDRLLAHAALAWLFIRALLGVPAEPRNHDAEDPLWVALGHQRARQNHRAAEGYGGASA